MLVPSMNLQEVSVEANAEYETLVKSSTLQRLIYVQYVTVTVARDARK